MSTYKEAYAGFYTPRRYRFTRDVQNTLDHLAAMRIHGATRDQIEEYKAMHLPGWSTRNLPVRMALN